MMTASSTDSQVQSRLKRFFRLSSFLVDREYVRLVRVEARRLEDSYGASASGAVLIQCGEVFVFPCTFAFSGHYQHVYYGLGTRSVLGLFGRRDFDLGILYPSFLQYVEERFQAGYGKLLKRQVGHATVGQSLYSGWMCHLQLPGPGPSRFYSCLTYLVDGLKRGVSISAFVKCQEA